MQSGSKSGMVIFGLGFFSNIYHDEELRGDSLSSDAETGSRQHKSGEKVGGQIRSQRSWFRRMTFFTTSCCTRTIIPSELNNGVDLG